MIERQEDGRWKVDVEPVKGRRFRRTFKTKAEAMRFEAHVRQQLVQDAGWNPKPKDRRTLLELIDQWDALHGHQLRDAPRRLAKLKMVANALGNPVASRLDANSYAVLRRQRLDSGTSRKTLNNELGYLRAVYNELRALGQLDYENPLAAVKPLKLQERELSWLTAVQVVELVDSIRDGCDNPHTLPVALICLATGARWSEAERLGQQSLRGSVATFAGTKSGKVRSVPIPDHLVKLLRDHWRRHGRFTSCITSFRRALARTSITLPPGQATHALRHTFASHFMQNGGNILTLQKILGHSSLAMTMRYAHLAPEHLQDALRFGPLSSIDISSTVQAPEKQNPRNSLGKSGA